MDCTILDILLYLKDTMMLIEYIMLKTQNPKVVIYSHWRSNISWKSLKQMVIVRSIMEYEFIALDKCEEEAEWLCYFLENIPR